MRHALAALLVASVTSTAAGCKDRSHAPASTTAASTAPRDAGVATAPAPAVPKTGAFAPAAGSWAHAVPLSRCVVRLGRAPEPEIERFREAAIDKLSALGSDIEIEMSDLGDRVHRADIVIPRTPPRRVLTAKTIQEIGRAALIEYAELFGLTRDEALHAKLDTERVRDFPGVAWEVSAEIEREGTGPMPVRLGQGLVVVELDRRGAITGIDVDPNLLPPVTVCTDTLPADRVVQAVVGRPLEWETNDSDGKHAGTVGTDDILDTQFRIRVVRGAGDEGDVTVGGVMEVKIEHDFLPWVLLVDPSAGIVIETSTDYEE